MLVLGMDQLQSLVGQTIGPTAWREVTQVDVNLFATLSGDRQWIHVDVERARRDSPYGTTIAHGNLTLSLIDGFRDELMTLEGVLVGVNYGWNRVRFPTPVPTGSRLRATAELVAVDAVGAGWWQVVQKFTIEVESHPKPACVAESIVRILAPSAL